MTKIEKSKFAFIDEQTRQQIKNDLHMIRVKAYAATGEQPSLSDDETDEEERQRINTLLDFGRPIDPTAPAETEKVNSKTDGMKRKKLHAILKKHRNS